MKPEVTAAAMLAMRQAADRSRVPLMAAASQDLIFRFLGIDAGAGHEFDRMAGKAGMFGSAGSKALLGVGAAAAIVAVESVKAASNFQASMELIHTQAGASQQEVERLSKSVLGLAGQTGTAPDELAKGLYHLESTGLRGAAALDALRIAAEGAKVGQADLEDVTNAVNAVIASGIKGASNLSNAMGMLNATVGAGDMHMQDLADAMGTGLLVQARNFGVSLNEVGAALAVFGDNNIRGADAATQLRMSFNFLSKGTATADEALSKVGLTSKRLSNDLANGGLNKAITDLHTHLPGGRRHRLPRRAADRRGVRQEGR
jgi:TP901 family phage tail tape measure protein